MSIPRQTISAVANVFVLPRCDVSIFETGVDNTTGNLVWTAKQVESLRLSERFDEFEQTSTGIPYPEVHHLASRHEITFDAVWNVSAKMKRGTEYVVAITWEDANLGATTKKWVRRFYGGAMTSSREIGSRDGNEFGSSNTLRAKYFSETESSAQGDPSGITPGMATC